MPQIWMTYDELAGLLNCEPSAARDRVQAEGLDRKKSRDGNTRVKLSLPMIGIFMDKIRAGAPTLDQAIVELRQAHALMSGFDHQQPDRPADGFQEPAAQAG